ncbi:MAG: YcxB family protein [Planctomycetes bacterium]|nr:YcxB family protein [Planctomycetota bacterium]
MPEVPQAPQAADAPGAADAPAVPVPNAEVSFELTMEDLAAFNRYHAEHSPYYRQMKLRAWFAVPAYMVLVGLFAVLLTGTYVQSAIDFWPLWTLAAVYALYYPFLYRKQLNQAMKTVLAEGKNLGLIGPHAVRITPEALYLRDAYRSSSIRWPAVEQIVRGRGYLYLYIASTQAAIVPERAFSSQKAFFEFCSRTIDYHGAAQESSRKGA